MTRENLLKPSRNGFKEKEGMMWGEILRERKNQVLMEKNIEGLKDIVVPCDIPRENLDEYSDEDLLIIAKHCQEELNRTLEEHEKRNNGRR